VGRRQVEAVSDGFFTMPAGFMTRPPFEHPFDGETSAPALPIASFVVPGERTVLLDAGFGPNEVPTLSGGALLDELAGIGVHPSDIDVIALSHLHVDHCGWLATADAQPVFERAVVHVGRADYDSFVVRDESPSGPFRLPRAARELLMRYHDDGRLVLIDDAVEFVPGVVALPAPGHTPGHCVFSIRGDGEQLLVLGDAMYCPAQLTDIDLAMIHDVDPVLARQSRQMIQRELEMHGTAAVGCHFPGLQAARAVSGTVTSA